MVEMIKLIKSSFVNEEQTKKQLCDFIIDTDILSMNKECEKFEQAFAKWHNRKYAILFNSGSSANLALLQAIKNLNWLRINDKVGFSALTWATNIMPLRQMGFDTIPIDVNLHNLNVGLNNLYGKKLNALFLTNALGLCADIENVSRWCDDNNVLLLEDNCESMGSVYNGRRLGNYGIASTTSFYVGHQMSTIEGGMVVTDNEYLYEMVLMVRCHGWTRNLSEEKQKEYRERNNIEPFYDKYTFYYDAFNMRPTEITGLLGNIQLQYVDNSIDQRDRIFKHYMQVIRGNTDLIPIEVNMDKVSNLAFPVICINKNTFNRYKQKAQSYNIEIRPMIGGDVTRQPFYTGARYNKNSNARTIFENGLYFPNNPELTEDEILIIDEVLIND